MKHLYFCVTNDLRFDQRMARICNSLQEAGYSVTLVGRHNHKNIGLVQKPYRQVRLNCFFQKGKWMYLEYNTRLFFYLLFKKASVITAIDLDSILAVYVVSILRRIPRVYDAHELFTEMKEVITRPSIHRIWLLIEKGTVPNFKHGYTVSPSIADEFRKRYGVQFGVIMNAPILEKPTSKNTASKKYIVYQGAVNEGRGLEWLIPAMKVVEVELWICGEGNFSDQCRQLIKSHGLENKVIMMGMKTPEELRTIAVDAYAGINLVEPLGLNQVYSLANKFFDYIHAGIPQLTMDFPEYKRINDEFETAILIDRLSPEIISTALNNLLQNEVLYSRLLINCPAAAAVYNWQNEERKLKLFYNKIFA